MEIKDGQESKPNLSEKGAYDLILIRAALDNGDQKAYAELMSRYRESLYAMVLKIVGNEDDADDLTIEAFGKAFLRLEKYTPTFAFSTWLFRIASNSCIDFVRKKKLSTLSIDRHVEDDEGHALTFQLPAHGLTPEEDLVKRQNVEMVRGVVDKLKPHYKQLIEMKYFDDLSIEEISIKMNMPTGTIKAQLFRAREFLANIITNTNSKKNKQDSKNNP